MRSIAPLDIPLHPTQIYMSLANYLVFIILMASREERFFSLSDIYAVIIFFLVRYYAYDFPINPVFDGSLFVIYISLFYWLKFILTKGLLRLREKDFRGMGASIYLLTYPVFRFIIEFFRGDPRGNIGPLSTSQFIGIILFTAGIFGFWFFKRKHEKGL